MRQVSGAVLRVARSVWRRHWPLLLGCTLVAAVAIGQGSQLFPRIFNGPVTINGDEAVSGTLTAATVQANVVDGGTVVATGPLTVGGLTSLQGVTNALQVDAGNITLAPPAKLCLNIACSVYLKNDGFDAWTIVGAVNITGALGASGTVTSDGSGVFKTSLLNSATSASCSSNTGAVCVDDANGLAIANGSGTTVATISNAGKATIATLAVTANTDLVTGTLDVTGGATATVRSGAKCLACWDLTAGVALTCTVSGTTLTLSAGSNGDAYAAFCPTVS